MSRFASAKRLFKSVGTAVTGVEKADFITPKKAALIGVPGAYLAGRGIFAGAERIATADPRPTEQRFWDQVEYQRETMLEQRTWAAEADALRQSMLRNTATLAARNPHLYNELLYGRRLPEDAVVFGGDPRTDLLEELAYEMANGRFQQPPDPRQQLMQMLGA